MSKDIFKDKKDKILIEKLTSENNNLVLDAISSIKEQGSVLFLPFLIELYKTTKFQDIKIELFNLFIDLKDKNAVQFIIDAIKNTEYYKIKKDLLSICWQSSLLFHEYIELFIDIFVKDDFEIAFEAFTIIEWMDLLVNKETINNQISYLIKNKESVSEQKQILFNELIKTLENLSE
jgi:hypothetical protein